MEDSELIVGFEALLGAMGEDQKDRILAWLRARIGATPPPLGAALVKRIIAATDAATVPQHVNTYDEGFYDPAPSPSLTPESVAAYLDAMTVCPVVLCDAIKRAVLRNDLHIEGNPALAHARRFERKDIQLPVFVMGNIEDVSQDGVGILWTCGCDKKCQIAVPWFVVRAMAEDGYKRITGWSQAEDGYAYSTHSCTKPHLLRLTHATARALLAEKARKDKESAAPAAAPPKEVGNVYVQGSLVGPNARYGEHLGVVVTWRCACGFNRTVPLTREELDSLAIGGAPRGWTSHGGQRRLLSLGGGCRCERPAGVFIYPHEVAAFVENCRAVKELLNMPEFDRLAQKGPPVQNIPGQMLPLQPGITEPGKMWIRDDQSSSAKPVNYGWHYYPQTVRLPVEGSVLNGPHVTCDDGHVGGGGYELRGFSDQPTVPMNGVVAGLAAITSFRHTESVLDSIPAEYREGLGGVGGVFR